jgi:hypothetical protein
MPFLAGGLARRVSALQLRDSAGLPLRVTGFAFKPSHPGDRAPERLVICDYCMNDYPRCQAIVKCWKIPANCHSKQK